MLFHTTTADLDLFILLNQSLRAPALDAILPVFSSRLALLVLLAAALAWAVRRAGPRQIALFLVLLAGMGLSDLACGQIKDRVLRVRPLNAVPGAFYQENGTWQTRPPDFVQTKENGSSYPSAHAANSMTLAVLAMLLWRRTRPWLGLLPLLVGWSRVYLGKHYPTDVLAGWLLGIVVAFIVWQVWTRLPERLRPPSGG
ncbi:phosphatase PAP2 family protein [Desulfovibrio aminophilus]|nr:phosphatase PAP2 family protein [Desulfovibrio aminophilus]MCM0756469.1 phosphatase PAP2 family protein [Desulfovibrio aminophilus]